MAGNDERKPTAAEHDARAMLLGRVYDWRDGTYCFPDGDGNPMTENMVDAMTLEPRRFGGSLPIGSEGRFKERNWTVHPCMSWESLPDD